MLPESPWYQEIEQQGRQKEAQEQLLNILQERFQALPPNLEGRIQTSDIRVLRELIKRSVKANSLNEFVYLLDGKLGQICTSFEVKCRISASIIGIDQPSPGKTAPSLLNLDS